MVELPAILAKGKALWPEAYPLEANTTPRYWEARYQQRPAPETGDYFKKEWIKTCVKLPDLATLNVYGGSDYAVTADGGDYLMAATTPFTSSSASTLTIACIYSTSGASRRTAASGWRPGAAWSSSGSRRSGPKS